MPKGYKLVDRRRKFTGNKFTKTGVAPLVEVDKQELGDTRLNPEESVFKLREEILKQESAKKMHGQDELQNADRSRGSRMPYEELLARLQKLNPGIQGKDGSPGSLALYYPKPESEYTMEDHMCPAEAWKFGVQLPPNGDFFRTHKYCGGFLKEPLPEWGSVTTDTSGIAVHEVEKGHNRGWRSVLIGLIKAHVVTYAAAVKEFGEPVTDQRSRFWFEQTNEYKEK